MNRLAGKTAIVTGGAVGIGGACVLRMSEEGAKVAIFDLLESDGRALADKVTTNGGEAAYWKVDVADETALKSATDAAASRFGGLNVMVNNAGISGSPKPTDQVSEEEWDRVQAVNVKGVFFGTKHAIPHLRAAGGRFHHQSLVHRRAYRRRRHRALSRVQGRSAADVEKRCDHLCAREYSRELYSSRLHLDANGGKPPARHVA